MRNVFILTMFAFSIFLVSFSIPDAHATTYQLQDNQSSCEQYSWNWDSINHICTMRFDLTINSGDTFQIYSGVTLADPGYVINDYGTMINNGTISVSTASNSIGAMHIIGSGINHGEIDLQDANLDIYGKLTNTDFKSYINVQASSRLTILSSGTVINNATIQINNLGVGTQVHVESGSTLDNSVKGIIYVNGELNIDSGGVINNSGTIENNSGGINNSGTIDDECGGIITGSITGNTAVNDCLPSQPTSL